MIPLQGQYNTALVYTFDIDQEAISQIIELCNQEAYKNSVIKIMPDTHAGAGCTIGTTMTIDDKVTPNLVGSDIGCGMFVVKLKQKLEDIDLQKVDECIKQYIPNGTNIRDKEHPYNKYVDLSLLKCKSNINIDIAKKSIGVLGRGNHFIEMNKDSENNIYLVIHSGSSCLGKQIAEYYQNLAIKEINDDPKINKVPKALCYLQGDNLKNYLYDMGIAQAYAQFNREAIADTIINKMNWEEESHFTTIHNYIDLANKILRKGAISAKKGEKVIIPLNRIDGSIIAIGKGNPDWNYSAPHGAGRILSRSKAKELLKVEDDINAMKENNIFSSTCNNATIDESKGAYKPSEEIINNIKDTVDIVKIIKPIYNFKAN
jgi:RNA-splicing ligase RtcB